MLFPLILTGEVLLRGLGAAMSSGYSTPGKGTAWVYPTVEALTKRGRPDGLCTLQEAIVRLIGGHAEGCGGMHGHGGLDNIRQEPVHAVRFQAEFWPM